MITDLRAAQLCLASYGAKAAADPLFDVFDKGDDDGICWGIFRKADCDVIVLRGSVTLEDWRRDAYCAPYMSRRMGLVHHGFYLGMDNAWEDMKAVLRAGVAVVVNGHSLGAARAAILTGIMKDDGRPPAFRFGFGEPKPGYQQLADFIKDVPSRSYRNGVGEAHDIVTDEPRPFFNLRYVHPAPLIPLAVTPDPNDTGPFVFHHMPLYVAALSNLNPA